MSTDPKVIPATRRDVRERAMQVLYAYELSHEPIEMLVETIAGVQLEGENYDFAQKLIYTALNHRTELDAIISQHLHNWDMGRIALLDHILLRLGVTEFLYFPDVPPKVTINECVDIAKRYSTENSGRFVNGLLDAMLKALKKTEQVKKSGRGLIDR